VNRWLIGAAHKSSGKTTVAIGLAAALRERGLRVQPFKKGPDYIDPMWLGLAAGRPCRNLDPHVAGWDAVEQAFRRHATAADAVLVEGNHGLHDGMSADGSDSNAALGVRLGLPVILVLDTRGTARGVAPLVLGYQAFEPRLGFAGVLLNRVGGARHESKMRQALERYTDLPVLGAIGEDPALAIAERHLGLVPSNEAEAAEAFVRRLGETVAQGVDLDRLLGETASAGRHAPVVTSTVASTVAPIVGPIVGPIAAATVAAVVNPAATPTTAPPSAPAPAPEEPKVRIAIARDEAFGFYYADDLEALEAAGATLVAFDTLRDAALPEVDGLFIGGGFPEALAARLQANAPLRAHLRAQLEAGLPAYAECGGLMYLSRSITWRGERFEMVGAVPADAVMHERPVGRGYVRLAPTDAFPWPAGPGAAAAEVRAHEFHHSSLENVAPGLRYAWRVLRGHGIDGRHDGLVHRNLLASYAHLRGVGADPWPARFVSFVRQVRAQRASPAALVA